MIFFSTIQQFRFFYIKCIKHSLRENLQLNPNKLILYARLYNFLNIKFSPWRLLRRSAYICPAALNSCSQATLVNDAMFSRLIGLSQGERLLPSQPGLVLIHLPCVAFEAKRKEGPRPARIITTSIQPHNLFSAARHVRRSSNRPRCRTEPGPTWYLCQSG